MKKNCQQEFECIDQETELAVKEIQLKKKVTENESEINKLRLQLSMKDGFQNALAAQKKQLSNIVSRFEADMFKLSKNLQGFVKLEAKGQQSQTGLQTFLCSIKQTINATLKSISSKLDAQRSAQQSILEQMNKNHVSLKEETASLYQQIIQQKNKQIKSLKKQMEKLKNEKSESTSILVAKTSAMETLLKTMMEQQLKNTEIEELRQEKSKLEKVLNNKSIENQQQVNKIIILERDLTARDQEVKQLRDEIANNRIILATYQTRIEQQMEEVRQWRADEEKHDGRKKEIKATIQTSLAEIRNELEEFKEDTADKNNELLDMVTKINRRLFDIQNDTRERLEITYEKMCSLPQELKKNEEVAQRAQREEIFSYKVPTAKRQTAALKFPVLTDEDFDF